MRFDFVLFAWLCRLCLVGVFALNLPVGFGVWFGLHNFADLSLPRVVAYFDICQRKCCSVVVFVVLLFVVVHVSVSICWNVAIWGLGV